MITFIYGSHGCGKTEYIYSCLEKDAENGREAILLVPEQTTVAAERELVRRLPPSAQLKIEATNLTRLCNRVFRVRGGLCTKHANAGIRLITMQRALRAVGPLLSEYSDAALSDPGLCSAMLRISEEFGSCGISPEKSDKAVSIMPEGSVKRKLRDISTVISAYRTLLSESFDDPADDLVRLSELEKPEEIFGNIKIYLDSFSGLTGVQLNIVKMLMNSAAETLISIPLPGPTAQSAGFSSTDTVSLKRMSDRLRSDAASSGREVKTLYFNTPHRYKNEALRLLSEQLWLPAADKCLNYTPGSVRIIAARDAYDEAEACAAEIRKLVDGGFRFRDIAVVARDATQYRGIIDRAFEDAGISWFLSEKLPLSASAPARLMLSALKILSGGWQAEDVIAHIKTGLCGLEAEECDLFDIYTERWHISGRGFTSGEWKMNPDGYREVLTERGAYVLDSVNRTREKLCSRLEVLNEEIRAAADCSGFCASLYRYMCGLDVKTQMEERAADELAEGRIREAEECSRIWNCTLTALEDLCAAYGTAPAPDLQEFQRSLKTVLESSYLGSIPVSCDAVTVGSADMLRADAPRCVILLGVYDGSFPAVPGENGLFSASERDVLSEYLPLLRDRESSASDELYYLRRTISFASEKLIFFTYEDSSSVPLSAVKSIVPQAEYTRSDADLSDRILSEETAAAYSNLLFDTPEAAALKELLSTSGTETPAEKLILHPVGSSELTLSPDSAAAAAGKNTVLTQSKLECFSDCPFKYYCRYTLGLDPGGKAAFSYASIGTFIHSILEIFLTEIYTVRRGVFPDDTERRVMLALVVEKVLDRLAPRGSGQLTARLKHLSKRLHFLADVITADVLCELSDSDFVPKAFELKIGRGGLPPLCFPTKDGGLVSLEGVIDRVDVFEKNGHAYFRTVDYKTGSKTFSLSDIDRGENLQLLLYLFSITRGTGTVPGISAGEKAEGAVTYLSAATPRVKKNADDREGIFTAVAAELSRSGALLDSEDVISALSRSGNDRYLMGKEGKRTALTSDGFDALYAKVSEILVSRAELIKAGCAAAVPSKGAESCKNCEFAGVCRSAVRN